MKASARRKRSTVSRLRPFWIAFVIVAGCIAWGAIALATSSVFALKRFTVTGLAHVSAATVAERAAIDPHADIWLLDKRAVEARIEAIPYVEFARVHRSLPANVRVDVIERSAQACLSDGYGHVVTIDAHNRVLEPNCSDARLLAYRLRDVVDRRPGAFVRDRELTTLEDDATALAFGGSRFHGFAHDRFDQLVATMADGIAVQFGDDGDLDRKQRLIRPILAQLGARALDVTRLDLRAPATPVVEYR